MNVIFPILEIFSIIPFSTSLQHDGLMPSLAVRQFVAISWDGVGLFQCISGFQLITSVVQIRNFFRERNDEEYINTGMLLRHSGAFALFMLTDLLRFITFTFFVLHPFDPTTLKVYLLAKVFWIFGSAISQILLSQIFWVLGQKLQAHQIQNKEEPEEADKDDFKPNVRRSAPSNSTVSINAEDYDVNDEMQARIWMTLVRSAKFNEDEIKKYTVSYRSTNPVTATTATGVSDG